jgi:glutathione S-transferase
VPRLTLISQALCPYVQRAAIVLAEKSAPFERVEIDLANKPDWFLAISPLGKTPVLRVDDAAIFESAVICEYIDETTSPRMHPADPLERALHRSWIEYGSAILNTISGFYTAADEISLAARRDELAARFQVIEAQLGDGPFFAGRDFSIVDATFGPIFRYFDAFDRIDEFGVFEKTPKVRAWRVALDGRESVRLAVKADYPQRLQTFLIARKSALSAWITRRLDPV